MEFEPHGDGWHGLPGTFGSSAGWIRNKHSVVVVYNTRIVVTINEVRLKIKLSFYLYFTAFLLSLVVQ